MNEEKGGKDLLSIDNNSKDDDKKASLKKVMKKITIPTHILPDNIKFH